MPGADAGGSKSQNFKYPLSVNILTIFLLVVALATGGVIYYNYTSARERTLLSAQRLTREIVAYSTLKSRSFVQPAWTFAKTAATSPLAGSLPSGGTHPLQNALMEQLDLATALYSVYMSYENGDFFQVLRVAQMNDAARKRFSVPGDSAFAVKSITRDGQGVRRETWSFLDKEGHLISRAAPKPTQYDPRLRPWYKLAMKHAGPVATEYYTFATLGKTGVTAAQKFSGPVAGVAGADLTAGIMCDFMASQKITKSGITLIIGPRDRIWFYPEEEKLIVHTGEGANEQATLATLTTLGNPVLSQLSKIYDKSKKWQWLDFQVEGRKYVGGMAREVTWRGLPIFITVLAPLDELLGPVLKSTINSLLVSGLIFLCVIPLVILISWRMSRPLNRLARETDRIRQFQLESSLPVKSRIREIHNLAQSVDTMKTALRTFGQYVPKALVKQLAATGQEQKLGGEKRVLSVLFSDVQNFTNMAEAMDPEELMLKTSDYFAKLCEVILAHGGTIDKFIGDAIMAFWNAPHKDAGHQRHACLAMLACRQANQTMDEQWSAQNLPVMYTRFGLHSGETIVGNLGSNDRMDYTALGATVNLASRLEGLNKYYGTQLLISQTVLEAVGDEFVTRPVDLVQPKGTSIPVGVFELVGLSDGEPGLSATPEQAAYCVRWSGAFALYLEREWDQALAEFESLAAQQPGDKLAAMYVERVRAYRQDSPPADWNGAEVFKVK